MGDFDHAKERRSKHLQPNPNVQAKAQEKRDRRMTRNLAQKERAQSGS